MGSSRGSCEASMGRPDDVGCVVVMAAEDEEDEASSRVVVSGAKDDMVTFVLLVSSSFVRLFVFLGEEDLRLVVW